MAVTRVRYEVEAWGVGELWLEGRRVVWHDLPRPGAFDAQMHPQRGDARPPTETLAAGTSRIGDDFVSELITRLRAYFAGTRDAFADVELDLDGLSEFGRACADSLRVVASGDVVTYGELAALAGRPRAARAAGTFCAHNRYGVFVPCHRVIASDGIGGYGSLGVEYKRRLLRLDGVVL